jgi:hypothetical protein
MDPLQLKRLVKINYKYYSLNFTLEKFWAEFRVDPYLSIKKLCSAYNLEYKMKPPKKILWFGKHRYQFKVEIKELNFEIWIIRQTSKECKRIAAPDVFNAYRKLIL